MTDYSLLALAVLLIYGAGIMTGWHLARRVTGYMLGGRQLGGRQLGGRQHEI